MYRRGIVLFGLIMYFCYAQDFILIERHAHTDGYQCVEGNVTLMKPFKSLTHCLLYSRAISEYKRVFYHAQTKLCIGCSTIKYQTSEMAGSYSFVITPKTKEMIYLGCFTDSRARTLHGLYQNTTSMTNQWCFHYCVVERGYRFCGTQNAEECFCGDSYDASKLQPDSVCDMRCHGDVTQICGGYWKISIYTY